MRVYCRGWNQTVHCTQVFSCLSYLVQLQEIHNHWKSLLTAYTNDIQPLDWCTTEFGLVRSQRGSWSSSRYIVPFRLCFQHHQTLMKGNLQAFGLCYPRTFVFLQKCKPLVQLCYIIFQALHWNAQWSLRCRQEESFLTFLPGFYLLLLSARRVSGRALTDLHVCLDTPEL